MLPHNRRVVWWLCVLAALACPCPSTAAPLTVDALPRSLAGEWEIAFGDPAGRAAALDTLSWRPIAVPAGWQDEGFEQHGTAWYRRQILIGPAVASTPMAFLCEQIRDADEVYLDGILVGSTGSFPPRYDKGTFMMRVYELPATVTSKPGRHELAVRVYNAGPRRGGITAEPILSGVSDAFWKRTERDAPRALLGAAIGALGLFALFFFLRDRRQVDSLLFFLLTSSLTVWMSTWLSTWTRVGVPLSFVFRVNFAGDFFLFLVFLLFFHRFFDRPFARRHHALLAVLAAGTLFCLFWPRVDDLYYALAVSYVAITLGGADILRALWQDSRRRMPHAREVLAGMAVAFLAVVHDIARDLQLLDDNGPRFVGPSLLLLTIVFLSVVGDRVKRLRVAATTDPLTGLANRSVLFERMTLEMARARRHELPLTLAILDLDHFKSFNDTHGHVAGDRILVATAQALVDSIRDTDLAARYGGEEFVVLLPEASGADSVVVLERIRQAVAQIRLSASKGGTTVSIGVAEFDPIVRPAVSVTALLRQADAALYQAKAQGRDRIVVSEGRPLSSASGVFDSPLARRRSDAQGQPGVAKISSENLT